MDYQHTRRANNFKRLLYEELQQKNRHGPILSRESMCVHPGLWAWNTDFSLGLTVTAKDGKGGGERETNGQNGHRQHLNEHTAAGLGFCPSSWNNKEGGVIIPRGPSPSLHRPGSFPYRWTDR